MNDSAARNLIKTTFENPYSRDRFLTFTKNLFKSFDESKAFHARGYVKDKFKKTAGVIKTYERLSTYTDPDGNRLDILTVFLEKDNSLDKARTTQRNFIADYLKQRDAKEAALVAFVPPKVEEWRLSLVKTDYHLGKTKSGKIKAIAELTPARRFSYLVGRGESTHTAQKQLLPILLDDDQSPKLTDLESAFSVEVVTKDFFEKYKTLFLNTKEALDKIVAKDTKVKSDFTKKNIDTVDFAKKLLGQIVFLYFLQRKGWFGVKREQKWGSGPKAFLRELFNKKHGNYSNFFNDILEPLFYNTLAVERPYDYSDKFDCRIPFLNGGLFDPLGNYDWYKTDIILPDRLFSNKEKTKEGDIGTGVLDVFDRYNFTVKEDEPLDKEVAVDPEMLGKVFENLLEVKDRKSKGTYYTPREIVHYMCQQSLINYLSTELDRKVKKKDLEILIRLGETAIEHDAHIGENGKETSTYSYRLPESVRKNAKLIDEKLASIRVCDPAIGSGAFPVGMMSLIVKTRNVLTSYFKDKTGRSTYDFKRHAIANSLYGVDIDLGAVEIAKLRLWLSLIVDEQDIKKIKPLPNLDYKIMQGNSLVELLSPDLVRKGIDQEKNKLIDQLNEFKNQYFEATSRKEKIKLRNQINEHIVFIANYDKAKKLEQSKNLLADLKAQKSLFSLGPENLTLGEVESKEVKKLKKKVQELRKIKDTSPEDHFEWHLNFNEVFEESNGFDVIIANPPYINIFNISDVNYRNYLKNNFKIAKNKTDLYAFFTEKGISILKKKGNLVFIFSNSWLGTDSFSKFRKFLVEKTKINTLVKCPPNVFEEATVTVVILIATKEVVKNTQIRLVEFTGVNFKDIDHPLSYKQIKNQIDHSMSFERLIRINVPFIRLGDIAEFSLGIKTSDNTKFILDKKKDKDSYKVLKGKDIAKYYIDYENKWLWYKPRLMMNKKGAGPRKLEHFLMKKILIRDVANDIQATLDTENYLTTDTIHILYRLKMYGFRYILGLLNSKLVSRWLKQNYPAGLHVKLNQLRAIPLPAVEEKNTQEIAKIVSKILQITSSKFYQAEQAEQIKVKSYKKQIDQLVYKLYGLTPDEIEIVESNT